MLLIRLFIVSSILVSGATGDDGHLENETVSSQQMTTPSDRCKLSSGFVRAPLMVAIWQGDFETVKRLVESGSDVNVLFPVGNYSPAMTPLTYAIQAKNDSYACSHSDEMTEYLLAHKADPNLRARRGVTSLHMAAAASDVSSLRILLKHKARLEDRTDRGETALMVAARQNKGFLLIQELVSAGADVHAVDNFGNNAVMLAAWQHHLDAVKLLVRLGVNPCAKNKDGKTAIYQAMSNTNNDPGKQEIISLLQHKCELTRS